MSSPADLEAWYARRARRDRGLSQPPPEDRVTVLERARRGWTIAGRKVQLLRSERSAERRAMSWCGIGPARETGGDPPGPVVGVAVHAGPWLWVAMWLPTPRTPARLDEARRGRRADEWH